MTWGAPGDVSAQTGEPAPPALPPRIVREETPTGDAIDLDKLPLEERARLAEMCYALADQLFVTRPIKRLRSERFTILTDIVDDENVRTISSNLEATFDVLDALFAGPEIRRTTDASTTPVYVYQYPHRFAILAESFGIESGPAGLYAPIPLLAFPLEAPSHQALAAVMLHEATHAYLDRHACPAALRLPLWLEEGLAEYVGTSSISRGKLLLGTVRRTQQGRMTMTNVKSIAYDRLTVLRKSLRKTGRPTVRELLSADRATFYGEDREIHYAGAWMLVHYLRHGGADYSKRRFPRLLASVCSGEDSPAALRAAYGDLDALEASFRLYVKRFGDLP